MSLTSLLRTTDSVVSRFFKEVLPKTREVLAMHNPELKQITTVGASADLKGWYPTIGTAIDYRLRYYFPPEPYEALVAYQGAVRIADHYQTRDGFTITPGPILGQKAVSLPGSVIETFFLSLDSLLNELKPADKRLPTEQERELCSYCFVLALFEQVFRAGPNPHSALFSMEKPSFEAMLELVPKACVEDMCCQSWLFHDRLGDEIDGHHVLNPTFDGSADVGGADADLILGHCLIDFKSTINPKITGNWLYQVIGYVLLDYTERHQIDEVGIYFSRQGVLLRWDLVDLIARLSAGSPPSVNELRSQFCAQIQI